MGLHAPNKIWKKDEIAALIALFETERCLYDETDKLVNDTEDKREAYNRIYKIMLRIRPDCSVDEIIFKIRNFKQQYISEISHRDVSVKAGLCTKYTYKPRVWYFDLLQFLDDYLPEGDLLDARDNSDILEETDDNEEVEQNIVRKKRKIREESSSSEKEVSNVSSSSVKKYHSSTTEKKSHSNSSSVKKVQNTSVSQKKHQITPLQKKKHSSASSEKVLHDSSSQKKVNSSLSPEIEPENSLLLKEQLPQKNSSLSEKEQNNSSSSERELKSSSSEKDMNSSSDIESKKESHKSSFSDIPDKVPALNSLDREDIFGQYVASELRSLRNNPLIYLQTKQSILESITSANFELLNPDS